MLSALLKNKSTVGGTQAAPSSANTASVFPSTNLESKKNLAPLSLSQSLNSKKTSSLFFPIGSVPNPASPIQLKTDNEPQLTALYHEGTIPVKASPLKMSLEDNATDFERLVTQQENANKL